MATPWLDAARYADTCGIHTDAGRQIWPWRDWLLGALRDDMPFDRFLDRAARGRPPARRDRRQQRSRAASTATHVTNRRRRRDRRGVLVEYAVDRTARPARSSWD
jgi:hypothetical protein